MGEKKPLTAPKDAKWEMNVEENAYLPNLLTELTKTRKKQKIARITQTFSANFENFEFFPCFRELS